jgi:hypothetical protein
VPMEEIQARRQRPIDILALGHAVCFPFDQSLLLTVDQGAESFQVTRLEYVQWQLGDAPALDWKTGQRCCQCYAG